VQSRLGARGLRLRADTAVAAERTDPETRWFLESTAELREDLLELWRVKRERHALLKLRGRLNRVAEDRTLSDQEKAAHVLAMFDATTDDETGIAARDVISEFVAESMPGIVLPARVRQ